MCDVYAVCCLVLYCRLSLLFVIVFVTVIIVTVIAAEIATVMVIMFCSL